MEGFALEHPRDVLRRKGDRLSVTIVFLLSLFANFAVMIANQAFTSIDTPTYTVPAENLMSGRGFVDSTGAPETSRTPGYPLFIGLTGGRNLHLAPTVAMQHLLNSILAAGVWWFTLSATRSRSAALIAGVLFALDVISLHAANKALSDTLFTFLLFVSVVALYGVIASRHALRAAVISGIALGAATLTRPISLYFIVPAILFLLVCGGRRAVGAATLFFVAFAIPTAAWMQRNRVEGGAFTLSSIAGTNILFYRAAGALAGSEPGDLFKNFSKYRWLIESWADSYVLEWYGRDPATMTLLEKRACYEGVGKSLIVGYFPGYCRWALRGMGEILLDLTPPSLDEYGTSRWMTLAQKLVTFHSRALFVLALGGLIPLARRNRPLLFLVLLTVACFVAISAGPEAYRRFRVPVVPLYVIPAATLLSLFTPRRFQDEEAKRRSS